MIRFLIIAVLSILLIAGCSSTSTVTITEVDTIIVRDTVQLVEQDTIWYGGIYNNKDSIGSLAVYPKSKKAAVLIKWLKADTVYYEVPTSYPVILDGFLNRVLETFFKVMPFWQKLLIILLIVAGFYIYYLFKRK